MVVPANSLATVIADLREAPNGHWAAKDILRAAGLAPLKPKHSAEVAGALKKIRDEKPISPILLVGGLRDWLVIADGRSPDLRRVPDRRGRDGSRQAPLT